MKTVSRNTLVFMALFIATTAHAGSVKIVRDEYGIPSVYADTTHDLFYGYGYAVAEDRLYQTEMAIRSTQGRVSELLGEAYLTFDIDARRRFDKKRILKQIADLKQADRDILEGYAAGYNAFLKQMQKKDMPYEFVKHNVSPMRVTAYDIAMIFVGTMANRYSDFSTELQNRVFLNELRGKFGEQNGMSVFNQLKWRRNEDSIPTIPSRYRYQGPIANSQKDAPQKDDIGALANLLPPITIETGASTAWLLGSKKSKNADSIIVNGPQFGLFDPSYVYNIGLHGAGFDIAGNTPFGYPAILFGHNTHIAFGSTAGFGETVDFFELKLKADDHTQYWYLGAWKALEVRSDTILVKGKKPVVQNYYRSVHGTLEVIDKENHIAYARGRSWDGYEIESLIAWTRQAQAKNWSEWRSWAEKHALTINWYYADKRGNIGYIHTGRYPKRVPGHDHRLPVPGDGSFDWNGRIPFDKNPQIYNPNEGYIANWNNSPMNGYEDPDMLWWKWGAGDRVIEISQAIEAKEKLSPRDAWNIVRIASEKEVNWRYLKPLLKKHVDKKQLTTKQRKHLKKLLSWKGKIPNNEDSVVLLHAVLRAMLVSFYSPLISESFLPFFTDTIAPTDLSKVGRNSNNVSTGTKTMLRTLQGKAPVGGYDLTQGTKIREFITSAFASGSNQYLQTTKKNNFDKKKFKQTFNHNNFMGVPQRIDGKIQTTNKVMNRGTENNITYFNNGKAFASSVTPPGQSGYRDAKGNMDDHCCDQVSLYNNYKKRSVLFYKDAVEERAITTTVLETGRQ